MNIETTKTGNQSAIDFKGGLRSSLNVKKYHHLNGPENTFFSRTDFFKIWLVLSPGYLVYDDQRIYLEKEAFVFLNPLVPFAFESQEKEHHGYWCVFKEEFMNTNELKKGLQGSPLFKMGSPYVSFPDRQQLEFITSLFESMIREMHSTYLNKYDVILNYTNLLMHEGLKTQPDQAAWPNNAASRISSNFMELLESQFPLETDNQPLELRRAGDYAGKLSVHINHLNHAVKETTGKATSTHITERMVHEAIALLRHTDWSISHIAYGLGFEYPNHFNTFFKKHMGVTPLSIRK